MLPLTEPAPPPSLGTLLRRPPLSLRARLWIRHRAAAAKRQLGACALSQQVRSGGKKLRLWQRCLPVWTTGIFIAFENALMSVVSTDYTTFSFLLSASTDMEWWNYSWCQGMRFFYALSKQNKTKQSLLVAAHIQRAPRSQPRPHHLHPGCWVAGTAASYSGPTRRH